MACTPQQADFLHKIWAPRPMITTGGYTRETAMKVAEETGQLVGFGQFFLANVRASLDIPPCST